MEHAWYTVHFFYKQIAPTGQCATNLKQHIALQIDYRFGVMLKIF